jgi:ComEC/Rec2-related protein
VNVRLPHLLAGSLCAGLAAANLVRLHGWLLVGVAAALVPFVSEARRPAALALAVALAGLWWASGRLDALDRSTLAPLVGTAERAELVVTGPARRGRFDLRAPARVERWGSLRPHEAVELQLPLGRPPPQGARLDALGELREPRGASNGWNERLWLRRRGVHVVLRVDRWRAIGRRSGVGGLGDRIHDRLAASVARGLHGERRAVLLGVVLGEEQGLSRQLRDRFRASGLYHLLAVSGQNVALVASGALVLAWLVGLPRLAGEVCALAAMAAYVLAVGAQPSVVRAGVAGALGSLAWLTARRRDRWHFLLVGAATLLTWNPYLLLDAGFELSFAAVASIFVLVPRLLEWLEGYPVPASLREPIAVSTACGAATAPICWLQFHAVPLLTVPANALAAPVVVPLLGLALAAAAAAPLAPSAAAALAWLNGWCAAYLAACARLVGGLPGAQVRSAHAAAVLAACALLAAAYAWRRGGGARAGLPAHGRRSAEDRPRAGTAAGTIRPECGGAPRGAGDAGE